VTIKMTRDFIDIPTLVYMACAAVGIYGFSLFTWWWKKIGSATEVYAYVTFLFFAIFISASIGIYSRYLHVISEPRYHAYVNSFWWGTGPVMILIVLLAICGRMTRRVWILRKGTEKEINEELRLMTCPHCGEPCPRWEVEEVKRAKLREGNKKMTRVKLYAEPECWLFREKNPKEYKSFGCGPGGAGDKLVPDTMYGLDISEACRVHDWYYRFYPGNTEEDRKMADRVMKNNLLRIVKANTSNGFLLWLRRRRCHTYYIMVRNFGATSYFEERNEDDCMAEV